MENLGIFYDHMVYFTAIGNSLWPFGIFCSHLVHFPPFWYFEPRKIWQPRDRCYDHNFLQFFDNFRQKNWRFS
jgi:hypothetical protein